jgi:hypothetical protein
MNRDQRNSPKRKTVMGTKTEMGTEAEMGTKKGKGIIAGIFSDQAKKQTKNEKNLHLSFLLLGLLGRSTAVLSAVVSAVVSPAGITRSVVFAMDEPEAADTRREHNKSSSQLI